MRPQFKNIDVEIPRDKLVVVTGLSGSGKSSLASWYPLSMQPAPTSNERAIGPCPAVLGKYGKTRCGLHWRLESNHFHRPKTTIKTPVLQWGRQQIFTTTCAALCVGTPTVSMGMERLQLLQLSKLSMKRRTKTNQDSLCLVVTVGG